jgi:hypothetical protein
MGPIIGIGLYVCYFVIFREFGFNPMTLLFLTQVPFFTHRPTDIFDPSHKTMGNTNVKCDGDNFTYINSFGKSEVS